VARCGAWLDRELALLAPRVVLALGAIAWEAFIDHMGRHRVARLRPRPRFAHDAMLALAGAPVVVASYHVSQQNTQTGRLTARAFDRALRHVVTLANL
jgi:uracil-DNA glycosylase